MSKYLRYVVLPIMKYIKSQTVHHVNIFIVHMHNNNYIFGSILSLFMPDQHKTMLIVFVIWGKNELSNPSTGGKLLCTMYMIKYEVSPLIKILYCFEGQQRHLYNVIINGVG